MGIVGSLTGIPRAARAKAAEYREELQRRIAITTLQRALGCVENGVLNG